MAANVTILRKYRPELERERTIQTWEAIEHISRRTHVNEGEIRFVVYELRDIILHAAHRSRAVKIEGLGTFTPTVRIAGNFDMLFRPDPGLLEELNNKTRFSGKIINKAYIGKSAEELFALWNQEHPDDLLE